MENKTDLDLLAEAYARGEMPEGTKYAQIRSTGGIFWSTNGNYFSPLSVYLADDIIDHYHKLSGKPKEWVHDWARFKFQSGTGIWYESKVPPIFYSVGAFRCKGMFARVGEGLALGDCRDTLEERNMEDKQIKEVVENLANEVLKGREQVKSFDWARTVRDIASAINANSLDNYLDTPDFELAEKALNKLLETPVEQPKWNGPEDGSIKRVDPEELCLQIPEAPKETKDE